MKLLKLLNHYEAEAGKSLDAWGLLELLKNDEKALRLFANAIIEARENLNHIVNIIKG